MNVIGIKDDAERQHELAEIGTAGAKDGPIKDLIQAGSLSSLRASYEASLALLEEKVAKMPADHPQLAYYRTLIVTTKKVELELRGYTETMKSFYRDLEEMHDFIHEIYPAD
jgi:hypothetical protein